MSSRPGSPLEAIRGEKTLQELAAASGVLPVQMAQWKNMALEAWPKLFSSRRGTKRNEEEALQAAGFVRHVPPSASFSCSLQSMRCGVGSFFGWNLGALACADIVLLWALIVATIMTFWRVRPLASALLMPYLLWVSFAAVLNYRVWQLNPQLLGS